MPGSTHLILTYLETKNSKEIHTHKRVSAGPDVDEHECKCVTQKDKIGKICNELHEMERLNYKTPQILLKMKYLKTKVFNNLPV